MTNIEVKSNSKKEKINIYNSMNFKSMRRAGNLAAKTLDFITVSICLLLMGVTLTPIYIV